MRTRLNLNALRKIIPFIDFKCSPNSSIIKDLAIKGSDIDGALVILESDVSLEDEITFVHELRKQGFNVYHEQEIADIRKKYESESAKAKESKNFEDPDFKKALNDYATSTSIVFSNKDVIEHAIENGLGHSRADIYLAGASIPETYRRLDSAPSDCIRLRSS